MDFVTPFIEWLFKSEYIKNSKVFLNAVEAADNNIQIATQQVVKTNEYIDGSALYKIIFTVFDYKSVSFFPLLKNMLENNENIIDLQTIQAINSYVLEQEKNSNYPDSGSNFEVQNIYPQYITPSAPAIDNALAKYSIPIVCEVLAYEN